jgi:transforming growth factor-beta-induced protein
MKSKVIMVFLFIFTLATVMPAMPAQAQGRSQLPTIADIVVDSDDFDSLELALTTAGLAGVFADPDERYTVFAPTDDAFAALGEETLNAVLNDTELLTSILLYHAAEGNRRSQSVVNPGFVKMLDGNRISVDIVNGQAVISTPCNTAVISTVDIEARNGIIHVIDAVLLPGAVCS